MSVKEVVPLLNVSGMEQSVAITLTGSVSR